MNTREQSLRRLLIDLRPKLMPGVFVFASLPSGTDIGNLHPIATFRELEGLTVILEESRALELGIEFCVPILFRAAWITLEIQSDLATVGLTAAVATALARENIACNVIAAAFHDHLFVHLEQGPRALAVLEDLAAQSNA